jgi:cyclase
MSTRHYKSIGNMNKVYIKDGREEIELDLEKYIKYIESLNVGEIYLNSIDKDGTGFGYDINIINEIIKNVNIPTIIAGGAGNEKHLEQGLRLNNVNGAATANLFNFIGNGLPNARKKLLNEKINIANWSH